MIKFIFRLACFFLIVAIGISVILIISNPSKEEFLEWALIQVRENFNSYFERVLGGILVDTTLEQLTDREDFLFFSYYTIHVSDGEKYEFVGILKQFVGMDKVDETY